jgi:hypothetical protein
MYKNGIRNPLKSVSKYGEEEGKKKEQKMGVNLIKV